jgi:hypothetical protein
MTNDSMEREKASAICKSYVTKNIGATNLILKKVFNI